MAKNWAVLALVITVPTISTLFIGMYGWGLKIASLGWIVFPHLISQLIVMALVTALNDSVKGNK